QQALGAESGIDGGQSCKRTHEETGPDEEQGGKRDLESDDGLSDEGAAPDAVGNLRAHGRHSRRGAEQEAGGDRNERGESKHLPVETRRERRGGAASDVGDRQSTRAADR